MTVEREKLALEKEEPTPGRKRSTPVVVNADRKSLTDNAGLDIAPVIKSSAAVEEEAVVDAAVVEAAASATVAVAEAAADAEAVASETARLTASGAVTSLTTAFLVLTSWALRLAQRERHLPS